MSTSETVIRRCDVLDCPLPTEWVVTTNAAGHDFWLCDEHSEMREPEETTIVAFPVWYQLAKTAYLRDKGRERT